MERFVQELIKAFMDALKGESTLKNHKVSGVQLEKYDESLESFDTLMNKFQAFLEMQNVPKLKRTKTLISNLSVKLYNFLKHLLAP